MTPSLWLVVLIVFVAAAGLPGVIRPVLERLGVIDIPNERSSHTRPAIRGVGLATMLALAVGAVLILVVDPSTLPRATILACLGAAFLASLVGLVEDVRGIPTRERAILQLAVGLIGAAAIVVATGTAVWWIPLGALAIAVYINAANFMDGVDGISGLHGLVVGVVYALIGQLTDTSWLVLGGSLLAVAFLGFLPWNVIKGRMFLGDVGSYLLGALVTALAFGAFVEGISPVALTAPVVIYLADTGTTLIGRIRRGESWFEAHRSHVYQRLTDRGLTHLQVAALVALLSLVSGLIGLLAIDGSAPRAAISIALIAGLAIAYVRSAGPAPIGRR